MEVTELVRWNGGVSVYQLQTGQIYELVLSERLHHVRPVLPHLVNHAVDGEGSAHADLLHQVVQSYEGASASHPSAAVHTDGTPVRQPLSLHAGNEAQEPLWEPRRLVVWPSGEVEVSHPQNCRDVALALNLEVSRGVVFRCDPQEADKQVSHPDCVPCPLGEVWLTLLLVPLHEPRQHNHISHAFLPQHLPELQHGLLLRGLRRYEHLAHEQSGDVGGVDVLGALPSGRQLHQGLVVGVYVLVAVAPVTDVAPGGLCGVAELTLSEGVVLRRQQLAVPAPQHLHLALEAL